jgi:hypothetical protein
MTPNAIYEIIAKCLRAEGCSLAHDSISARKLQNQIETEIAYMQSNGWFADDNDAEVESEICGWVTSDPDEDDPIGRELRNGPFANLLNLITGLSQP